MHVHRWSVVVGAVFLMAGSLTCSDRAFAQEQPELIEVEAEPQAASGDAEKPAPVGPDNAAASPPGDPEAPASEAERDPFGASGRLGAYIGDPLFTPSASLKGIPKMRMKGYLEGADGEKVALLELVGGGVHIVREGETVGLYEIGRESVIRIQKINRLHLVVEAGSLGQLIIVR